MKRLDFDDIDRAALAALPAVLARVLPSGKAVHKEWVALNPRRRDKRLGSFKVNRFNGKWCDYVACWLCCGVSIAPFSIGCTGFAAT